jgi:hypothetical protein
MNNFGKGFVFGIAVCAAVLACYLLNGFFHKRDRAVIENLEAQNELYKLREDYGSLDGDSFLDGDAGVRGAADRSIGRLRNKRDEVIRRIRGGGSD